MTRWRTNSIIARIPALPAHQPDQEPPERTQTTVAPEPGISPAPAQQLLALQRQVGNRAVGAFLARAPKTQKPPKMPAPVRWATPRLLADRLRVSRADRVGEIVTLFAKGRTLR